MPLFSVGCIDLYCPFNMLLGVWQNDSWTSWEAQRFSHMSLSGWWETPLSVLLLLTLKINKMLPCAHSRGSVFSLKNARGTDLYSSELDWGDLGFWCPSLLGDLGTIVSVQKVGLILMLSGWLWCSGLCLPLVAITEKIRWVKKYFEKRKGN